MKVYGIPNCNSVKKALDWLTSNSKVFELHDYKKKGITEEKLTEWSQKVGWEKLLNKKGTTWRMLPREQQQSVTDTNTAIALMIAKPSVIKRPVLENGETLIVGFDVEDYNRQFTAP